MAITCFLSCGGVLLVGVSETVLLYPGAITFIFFITGFYCERAISTARQRAPRRFVSVRATGGAHALPHPMLVEPTMRTGFAAEL
jgi:hypothetical protein